MSQSAPSPGLAVRLGFWATVVHGGLALLAVAINPLAGVLLALVYCAAAIGIHRRHAWAAIAAVVFIVAPLAMGAARLSPGGRTGFAIAAAVELLFAICIAGAAIELWRGHYRTPWPWAPAAALFAIFWIAFVPFAVAAGSMEKTLVTGDQVLVETASWRLGRSPGIGDIVVVHYPSDPRQLFIKRIVAGPGDRLRIRDKQLFRNGDPVVEPYAIHGSSFLDPYRDNFPSAATVPLDPAALEMLQFHAHNGELEVPDGRYFVLGDNRDDSLDSRYFGFVSAADIYGSPLVVYASYEMRSPAASVTPSVRTLRWNRVLRIPR